MFRISNYLLGDPSHVHHTYTQTHPIPQHEIAEVFTELANNTPGDDDDDMSISVCAWTWSA